jgi:hypothetical protein
MKTEIGLKRLNENLKGYVKQRQSRREEFETYAIKQAQARVQLPLVTWAEKERWYAEYGIENASMRVPHKYFS